MWPGRCGVDPMQPMLKPPPAGRLKLFFSVGDLPAAWEQLLDVAEQRPLLHGDTGVEVDVDSLRGSGRPALEAEAVDLAQLLHQRPKAVLMPSLVGSVRNGETRWGRTQALLAAGISVFAPLDVTELASLVQTVTALTGRRPLAVVSDAVLRRADEIVLVDRRRAVPDSAVSALRMLALRSLTAIDRSAEVPGTRDDARVVAVIGVDEGSRIVEVAHRLAQQLESSFEVICLQPPESRYASAAERESVQRALKLAARLGARTATIPCLNIADAVTQYVQAHRCRHVVAGMHGRSSERWSSRLAEVVPDVQLTLIPVAKRAWHRTLMSSIFGEERESLLAYLLVIIGCALVTGVGLIAHGRIANVNIALLYLLLVLVIGRSFGRYPAVLGALLGSSAFYLCFVPPTPGFGFNDLQYSMTFAVMLTVALITGNLTAGMRFQSRAAVRRESRTRALYELAQALSGVSTRQEVAAIARRILADNFKIDCSLLCPDGDGRLLPVGGGTPIRFDMERARRVLEASDRRLPPPDGADGLLRYLPLRTSMRSRGVLVCKVETRHWRELDGGDSDLDTCASLIAIALERIHYVDISQEAFVRIESERLRNSLLTAISHDLRTPLTALVGLTESLHFAEDRRRLRQGIDEICDEAARLSRLVDNLLDMARLQTGAVKLHLEWQSVEEVVGCALYSLRLALQRHRIETDIPAQLPLVRCDAALIERVLANLLENAAKYVPAGGRIRIAAAVVDDHLEISVDDDGPGVDSGIPIFEKFSRGDAESAIPGVGLGLAICRSIVEAHGGRIWQQAAADGGACFRFTLPLNEPPPAPEVAAIEIPMT